MANYQKIGDIVILQNKEDASKFSKEKTICVRTGGIEGQLRVPRVNVVKGSSTVTIHTENKCKFKLDVAKVMFSKGNVSERKRMADISNSEETVIDMFAGIGYFTIPMAVHSKPKQIFAIELNPDSYEFLCENAKLNKVESIVKPMLWDCSKVELNVKADRILMGLLPSAEKYLPAAMRFAKRGTVVHYHGTAKDAEELVKQVKEAAGKASFNCEVLKITKVKSYAPHVWHFVIDVKIN